MVRAILVFIATCVLGLGLAPERASAQKPRVLILVVDGLRPDYVTADIMPRLNALAEGGCSRSRAPCGLPDRDSRQRTHDFDWSLPGRARDTR